MMDAKSNTFHGVDDHVAAANPKRCLRQGEVVRIKDIAFRVKWLAAKTVTLEPIGVCEFPWPTEPTDSIETAAT